MVASGGGCCIRCFSLDWKRTIISDVIPIYRSYYSPDDTWSKCPFSSLPLIYSWLLTTSPALNGILFVLCRCPHWTILFYPHMWPESSPCLNGFLSQIIYFIPPICVGGFSWFSFHCQPRLCIATWSCRFAAPFRNQDWWSGNCNHLSIDHWCNCSIIW